MNISPVKNILVAFRTSILPILVWIVAVVGIVVLFNHRTQRFQMTGLALAKTYDVSTTVAGTLKEVNARLFEPVTKGTVIAILDDQLIRERRATVEAEIDRLNAEINSIINRMEVEAYNRQAENVINYRRFSADIERARLRILELTAVIEPDRIMLADLVAEIQIEKNLFEKGAVATEYSLSRAQARYDTLKKKIEKNEQLLEQAKLDLTSTYERRDEVAAALPKNPSTDVEIEVVRKAITIQEHLIMEILAESKALIIKAPVDGLVSSIMFDPDQTVLPGQIKLTPGQTILPGQIILTIAEQSPDQIVAYAGEEHLDSLKKGMRVELITEAPEPRIDHSQVTYVGPVIEELPIRLRRHPDIIEWGRPFIVQKPPQLKLVPGQTVGIRGL